MTSNAAVSTRAWRWTAAAAGLAAACVFLSRFPSPLSNIDDHNLRAFAGGYLRGVVNAIAADLATGRARGLYWVFEGALGAVTGSSGTVLHLGRLAFLAAAVALQVLVGRRLGAGPLTSALLAITAGWSWAGVGTWVRGGPAEAFAQPLALACTWLALGARTRRGIVAAAGLGLAAAFVKESYAVWTGAVLVGAGVFAFGQRPRGPWRWAVAGAAVQLAPVALALGVVPLFSGSYARLVLVDLAAPPAAAATRFLELNTLAAVLGAAGLVAVGAARLRDRANRWRWPLEDLVVVVPAFAVAAQTFLLGFMELRYQLPLATVLLLAAARGAAGFAPLRRRAVAIAAGVAMTVTVGAMGARAFFAAGSDGARCRADERMRALVGDALRQAGEVRILWTAADVEAPIGALTHLRFDGVAGRAQLRACTDPPRGMEEILGRLFAAHPGPTTDAAPIVAAANCGVAFAGFGERVCSLHLPDADALVPRLECATMPEFAALLR